MIFDKIENYKLYINLSKKIAKAFDYIEKSDFVKMQTGKYIIDNDDIFAMVQDYDTKDMTECNLERHFKYIDIQYVVSGVEFIGVTSLKDQIIVDKNEDNDYAFYLGDSDLIKLEAGMFAVFFPDDLHKPGIKFNQVSKVKKVVVKVRI